MSESEVKTETEEVPSTSKKIEDSKIKVEETKVKEEPKYFQCEVCALRESYEYFGQNPSFVKHFKVLENVYVIEDPFMVPKQNEFIILGSNCIKCGKQVCKDSNCSLYYDGTYCIHCAKTNISNFPENVQQKLNRIIT